MQPPEPYYLYSYCPGSYSNVLVKFIRFPILKVTFHNLMCLTYLSTFTVFPGTVCIFGPWFYNNHINWLCTAVRPSAPKYGKSEQLGVIIFRRNRFRLHFCSFTSDQDRGDGPPSHDLWYQLFGNWIKLHSSSSLDSNSSISPRYYCTFSRLWVLIRDYFPVNSYSLSFLIIVSRN